MEEALEVYRVGLGAPELVGMLAPDGSFAYAASYLDKDYPQPISASLPLKSRVYSSAESFAYFEGLVPEGAARTLLASELHVRESDWLSMLEACGLDCVGDLVFSHGEVPLPPIYEPLPADELCDLFSRRASMAELNGSDRLSLAGTQSKVGLAHMPGCSLDAGWMRAKNSAASTHILKVGSRDRLTTLEFLCTKAAPLCGVAAADVALLDFGVPVLCSSRFDRDVRVFDKKLEVVRLHQEDMAQAMGLGSGSKYAELEGGSIAAISRLLRELSDDPAADLAQLAALTCFNYVVGNCDGHLKNISLLYGLDWTECLLAPAYDIVCTTWFEDLTRDMGMAVGGVWNIDKLGVEEFRTSAKEMGLGIKKFASVAHKVAESVDEAIMAAADVVADCFEDVGWDAETLLADIAPRKTVLSRV